MTLTAAVIRPSASVLQTSRGFWCRIGYCIRNHSRRRFWGKAPPTVLWRTPVRQATLTYQDAISTTPGRSWRWVYADSLAPDHPSPCSEPVRWMGFRAAFGSPRVRFYSCGRHVEDWTS